MANETIYTCPECKAEQHPTIWQRRNLMTWLCSKCNTSLPFVMLTDPDWTKTQPQETEEPLHKFKCDICSHLEASSKCEDYKCTNCGDGVMCREKSEEVETATNVTMIDERKTCNGLPQPEEVEQVKPSKFDKLKKDMEETKEKIAAHRIEDESKTTLSPEGWETVVLHQIAGGDIEWHDDDGSWQPELEHPYLWNPDTTYRIKPAEPARTPQELYDELIMAVSNKHEGETRHETALRYIQLAEFSGVSEDCGANHSSLEGG